MKRLIVICISLCAPSHNNSSSTIPKDQPTSLEINHKSHCAHPAKLHRADHVVIIPSHTINTHISTPRNMNCVGCVCTVFPILLIYYLAYIKIL